MSPELGGELGIANGDHVTVSTLRGAVEARALVTRRIRPLRIDGRVVHQAAIPFHFGYAGPLRGDVVNDLLAISGEPNVTIMESKALVCNIVKGRLPRGAAGRKMVDGLTPPGDPVVQHMEQHLPGDPPMSKMGAEQGQQGQPS